MTNENENKEDCCDGDCSEGCECTIPDQIVFNMKELTVQEFVDKMVMIANAIGMYVAIPRHTEDEPFEGLVFGSGDYIEKIISGEYAIKKVEETIEENK